MYLISILQQTDPSLYFGQVKSRDLDIIIRVRPIPTMVLQSYPHIQSDQTKRDSEPGKYCSVKTLLKEQIPIRPKVSTAI